MLHAISAVRRSAVVAVGLAVVASLGLSTRAQAQGQEPGPSQPAASGAAAGAGTPKPLGYTPVGPVRLLDTRTDPTIHTRGPASTATLKVTGVAGVPTTGVEAVVLNVTAIATTHSTFITVYPSGTTRPTASNLNVALKHTRANQVIALVGAGGAISFYNSSGITDVLIDISGWFANGSSYTGRAPLRILDTRASGGKPRPAASTLAVQLSGRAGIPSGVTAVVLNLTGISVGAGTFVTAYPTGGTRPSTSNLNLVAAQTAAILVVATPNVSGQISLYNSGGPTHLLIDVAGWFTGTGDYHPVTPNRLLDSRITGGFLAGSTQWPVQVAGRGGVPVGATAAVLTVTVVEPLAGGHVTVFPFGTSDPGTSTVNVRGGETTANLAIVSLSGDGRIAVLVRDKSQKGILVDVVGWIDATPKLLVDPVTSLVGQVGKPFSLQLEASGGYPPYTWSAGAGNLPAGLSLSSGGLVSGTPTAMGAADLVSVTDAAGQTATTTPPVSVFPFVSRDVWGWGSDTNLFLTGTPTQVPSMGGALRLATARSSCDTTYAVHPDGTVWAWGDAGSGALGNGTEVYAPATAPVQVSGLTDVVGVAGQSCGGYALKSDGTVWAWGSNSAGALGSALPLTSDVPIQVSGLTDVEALASGSQNGYAIKSDGTLWAWGDNSAGELGTGNTDHVEGVVQVPGLTDVQTVTGGARTAYAVDGSGNLFAWGENTSGQVGTGSASVTPVASPTQVSALSNVTAVGAGSQTGYAVTSNGKAWAWGSGQSGELGNGSTADSLVPVQVAGLGSVTSIAGAKATGFALRSDGTVWAWGSSSNRLLGDGLSGPHTADSPVFVRTPKATAIVTHADGTEVYVIGTP